MLPLFKRFVRWLKADGVRKSHRAPIFAGGTAYTENHPEGQPYCISCGVIGDGSEHSGRWGATMATFSTIWIKGNRYSVCSVCKAANEQYSKGN